MRKGVLVNFEVGVKEAKDVHKQLKDAWQRAGDWLSVQDSGGFKAHVTVMNKVDDEDAVERALQDVQIDLNNYQPDRAHRDQAVGIALYKYDKGYWNFEENYRFQGKEKHSHYRLRGWQS